MIVPKKHIQDIYELDEKTGAEVMKELIKTAKLVKKGLDCEGVYITQANEQAAGQDVFHFHFHVYPRWRGQQMNVSDKVVDLERELTCNKLRQVL